MDQTRYNWGCLAFIALSTQSHQKVLWAWQATGSHANAKCPHNQCLQARVWLISQLGWGQDMSWTCQPRPDPVPTSQGFLHGCREWASCRLKPTYPHARGSPHGPCIQRDNVRADCQEPGGREGQRETRGKVGQARPEGEGVEEERGLHPGVISLE